MPLDDLKERLSELEEEIKRQVAERLAKHDITWNIVVAVAVAVITTLIIVGFGLWKLRQKSASPSQSSGSKKYRFRKRDKVLFYGRKMLRQVSSFSRNTIAAGLGQGKARPGINLKKKEILVLAKNADTTKCQLHKEYVASCSEIDPPVRTVKLSAFKTIWLSCLPHIRIASPRDDVCASCEKFRKTVADAVDEESKLVASTDLRQHILQAQNERGIYNECIKKSVETNSLPVEERYVHYTFDFSQCVSLPHYARQMGPLYFLSLRKVQIFGFRIDGVPQQLNFIVNEGETMGGEAGDTHGPNSVISMVDWALENRGQGVLSCTIHADNCPGQNKNKYVLGYFAWRVMTGQHSNIEYLMQIPGITVARLKIPGHARCLVDGGFAHIKKLYRRSDCETMDQIETLVNKSSSTNIAIRYPEWQWRDWKAFLSRYFKPLVGIRFSKILRLKKDPSQPMLQVKNPPKSFFEEDGNDIDESDHRIPSEVLYMLRSVRVFGHFEKPLFLELCKHMEAKQIPAGSYLFKVGDSDDSIYVIQSGKINVYIQEGGSEHLVKEVVTGDSIHSLLSILDCLTGNPHPYKTVCARAVIDSTILKLPATAFLSLFDRFPESLVRVVQVIMVRLQRVTFTALHNYLGLSSELINRHSDVDLKSLSIHSIAVQASQIIPTKRHMSVPGVYETNDNQNVDPLLIKTGGSVSSIEESDSEKRLSDFDAACYRAGVQGVSKQVSEEGLNQSSPQGSRLRMKRASEPAVQADYMNDEAILELAKKDLTKILKLKSECLLDDRCHLHTYRAGVNLIKQGDQDASLIFLVSGRLNVMQQYVGEATKEVKLFSAQPGEIVGALAVLTGEPSFFTLRSKVESKVVSISKNDFYLMMREQPSVVLNVASTTLTRLTPFVRQIDFALDWMMIEAGRALFRQGDHSDSVYIVLTGRLRTVLTLSGGKKEMVGEYGRGELVGIVEVLTQQERVTTGIAVRDTELAKLPSELLNVIKRKHPQVVTRLIHLLGQRIIGSMKGRDAFHIAESTPGIEARASVTNLATVAILPASNEVPLTNFTLELQHGLKAIGAVTRFTSEIVKRWLGAGALDSVNEFRLFSWLGQQEDFHRVILYQCDPTMTRWTKMCIRQADCILIVGLAGKDPKVGELEKGLESIDVRAQKELVLLHKEDSDKPTGTVEWLNERGWCSSHHHIRCPSRVFSKRTEAKLLEMYDEIYKTEPDRMSDISRLARYLTGTSVGLILGGGGARGLAHIGIIRALLENRIPIDMVGGTSMGSFIGAVWCDETNYTPFVQRSREWSSQMTSIVQKIFDLTYPVASMFTGSAFNKGIEDVFTDRQIEDLWIPYFCVTTDLTNSSMRIHRHGSLWRYVRASMSLAGYLPPLCDPVDGHLLLDGGYVNNLPADVMRSFGAQSIFAVDVGSMDNTELENYGDALSGWWLLWKRWNPWTKPVRVPDMQEIQSRLAYISGMRQLEIVKNSDYCEYIRPPIDKFYTLQFGAFEEIVEVGYNHGSTMLSGWEKGGLITKLFREKRQEKKTKAKDMVEPQRDQRLTYFTDLAELVSKIDEPSNSMSVDEFDGDDLSDSGDEDDISNTNQHAVKFSAGPTLNEVDEDNDANVVPDDDDENYITESDGEGESDDVHVELPTGFVTAGFGKNGQATYALPRRLSGYLKK